jgi:A/G-specific adenine glycosylase
LQSEIPAAKKPKQYEEVTQAAVVVRRGGKVLLRQCGQGERWAGLWDFPRFEVPAEVNGQLARHVAEQTAALTGVRIGRPRELATLRHGVTRFKITLAVLAAAPLSAPRARKSASRGIWVALSDLGDYPLSTSGRKIARLIS